jgi:hypothetical protein
MKALAACLHAIVSFFAEILFGCNHSRQTRPFTIDQETYKVCLDCGRKMYYSAQEMRPLTLGEMRRIRAAQAGEVRMLPVPAGAPHLVAAHERKPNIAA